MIIWQTHLFSKYLAPGKFWWKIKDKYIFFYHYLLTLLGQQHIGTFRMKKYMITKTYRCNQASTENIWVTATYWHNFNKGGLTVDNKSWHFLYPVVWKAVVAISHIHFLIFIKRLREIILFRVFALLNLKGGKAKTWMAAPCFHTIVTPNSVLYFWREYHLITSFCRFSSLSSFSGIFVRQLWNEWH